MKATSIKTPRTGAEWAQQTLERHRNAAIVKVLFNPAAFGVTRFLVIDADGYTLTGNAAAYQDMAGVVNTLYGCSNLDEAAVAMWERHYRNIKINTPALEAA